MHKAIPRSRRQGTSSAGLTDEVSFSYNKKKFLNIKIKKGMYMDSNIKTKPKQHRAKTVLIILTHSCNLSCSYCYEHHKNAEKMSKEMAKEIIEKEMLEQDGLDREFEFFGGEPFLEFEMVKELYDFLNNRKWDKRWIVQFTTNGVLVHGEIQKWLKERSNNIRLGLSADGTPEMHNANRSNSYDSIDFAFFAAAGTDIKMTVSTETLPHLSEGIIHLHKLGFTSIGANLAFGIDWSDDANVAVFSSELMKLADFYLENPDVHPSDILNMPIDTIYSGSRSYATRFCSAGVELAAYEIDGTRYPCHTFAPISAGPEIAKKALDIEFVDKISLDEFDEKCRQCIVASICPNCYGINFSTTGSIYSKDDSYCRMLKVQFLVNANFRYRQYLAGMLDLKPENEYRLLNNIALIQRLEV